MITFSKNVVLEVYMFSPPMVHEVHDEFDGGLIIIVQSGWVKLMSSNVAE